MTDLAEIHIIEMNRAKYEYEKDHNNVLAEWILFILDPNVQEVKSIMNENEEIKKTAEKLENLNDDENVRKRAEILARWELEEKWNRESLMDYVKKSIKEGIEKGKNEKIKEGKIEAKVEIAKKMLENSMDINTISEITGLSQKEIENLKN